MMYCTMQAHGDSTPSEDRTHKLLTVKVDCHLLSELVIAESLGRLREDGDVTP